MDQLARWRSFDGYQEQYRHAATTVACDMRFSVYLPPQARHGSVPVIYWLSGLTCTDENFVQKAGAQRAAAEHGVAIVAPDTSPRGEGVADDPEGAYDLGLGAGFYVDATQPPWAAHYQMYSYVRDELPALINAEFPVDADRVAIMGHSMGGHGALTTALKNPDRYRSVSAFSPICSPLRCPWGEKALTAYLGGDRSTWRAYDATALISEAVTAVPMLVDQGDADDFLAEQLRPELLEQACRDTDQALELRMQSGYDHSYFFIASFIADHIGFHASHLNA